MIHHKSVFLIVVLLFCSNVIHAQTWVDSLSNYAMEKYLPANKYKWTWQSASLLKAMTVQYELSDNKKEQDQFLEYVKTAMDNKLKRAHGKRPNAVASAHGLAFLARILKDDNYKNLADKIFRDYLIIPRTGSGGIAHLARTPELWDDTIYMIGVFLLEMYKTTGDEKYLNELMEQFRIHRSKLLDDSTGLWVHGWDGNNKTRCALCGQRDWPDKETRKSTEFWGRGNGWVMVTLSDALKTIPKEHPYWTELSGYLEEMIINLPEFQDPATGHWYQLPLKPNVEGNFIESSCTAMFGYAILTGLQLDIVQDQKYQQSIRLAYEGLRNYSIQPIETSYLTTKNVCKGTCIGDMEYYLNRKSTTGKSFGLAMFIIFGMNYELEMSLR